MAQGKRAQGSTRRRLFCHFPGTKSAALFILAAILAAATFICTLEGDNWLAKRFTLSRFGGGLSRRLSREHRGGSLLVQTNTLDFDPISHEVDQSQPRATESEAGKSDPINRVERFEAGSSQQPSAIESEVDESDKDRSDGGPSELNTQVADGSSASSGSPPVESNLSRTDSEAEGDVNPSAPGSEYPPGPDLAGGSPVVKASPDDTASSPDQQFVDVEELRRLLEGLGTRNRRDETGNRLPVMATIASISFKDFFRNWYKHLQEINREDLVLVAALDQEVYELCQSQGIPALLFNMGFGDDDFRLDFEKFYTMAIPKTEFVAEILKAGHDVLFSDTDVAWLADPIAYFSRGGPLGAADVLISSDSLSLAHDEASMKVDAVSNGQSWWMGLTNRSSEFLGTVYGGSAYNTGILMIRATPSGIKTGENWHEAIRSAGKTFNFEGLHDDQDTFNRLMHYHQDDEAEVVVPEDGSPPINRIIWKHNHTVKMAILPLSLFSNGHLFFVQRLHERHNIRPIALHNTYQFWGNAGKLMRFKEAHLWKLEEPSYYEEGNFLSFNATVPPKLIADEDNEVDRHLGSLHFYTLSLRNALAIARVLNRILILPQLVCRCDLAWNDLMLPCRFDGVDEDPPYICPMDHYLIVKEWLNNKHFKFRERTFLDHPQVPEHVRSSRKEIRVVRRREGQDAPEEGELFTASNGGEIAEALGRYANIRVLHLTSTADAFSGFSTEAENWQFENDKEGMLDPWDFCCTPGYDDSEDPKAHRWVYPPKRLTGEDLYEHNRWRPNRERLATI